VSKLPENLDPELAVDIGVPGWRFNPYTERLAHTVTAGTRRTTTIIAAFEAKVPPEVHQGIARWVWNWRKRNSGP
jgi:hypothetical protein